MQEQGGVDEWERGVRHCARHVAQERGRRNPRTEESSESCVATGV